jgi:hypothetical protein
MPLETIGEILTRVFRQWGLPEPANDNEMAEPTLAVCDPAGRVPPVTATFENDIRTRFANDITRPPVRRGRAQSDTQSCD